MQNESLSAARRQVLAAQTVRLRTQKAIGSFALRCL
jgi:hypothetical protein